MKRLRTIVMATLALVVAAAYALPAVPAEAASSAALSIVPRKNYTIEPGKSVKDRLIIRNLDRKQPLNLTLRTVDFTFTDDGGTPKLMLAEDAPQTTWSLKPFLTMPENVTIAPNSSKTVDMKVAIPAGHGAGSYYSAIVYSSGGSDGGNVGLNASGVTLVFVQIPGKVKEDLTLKKFGAYHLPTQSEDGKSGYTFIATSKPQAMAYTLENKGNVTESPVGTITLKHMFGQKITISNVNPNSSLALIGQTRTFTACIKLKESDVNLNGVNSKSSECTTPTLWPGLYHATLDIYYGQNGNNTNEIVKSITFWYLPWWFIITVLVILAIVGFYIWRIVRKVRNKMNGPKRLSRRR